MNVSRTVMPAYKYDLSTTLFLPRHVVREANGHIGFTYIDVTSSMSASDNSYYAVIDNIGIGCNYGEPSTSFRNVPKTHPWYYPIATEKYNEH